jgi:hypothetical protein
MPATKTTTAEATATKSAAMEAAATAQCLGGAARQESHAKRSCRHSYTRAFHHFLPS